jgi:hypothetical protein
MKQERTAQGIVIFAAALLAALALAASPAASTAQTNANASKAGARSASTPTATRQDNSNKAARPTAQKSAAVAPKAEVKEDPGKMTYTRPPHKYVIESSDTGHDHAVDVQVRNVGPGPSKAGLVTATVVYLKDGGDPRQSEVLGEPKFLESDGSSHSWGGPSLNLFSWTTTADLPPLKAGGGAQVRLNFWYPTGGEINAKPKEKWRYGVVIIIGGASFKDFLSAAFFGK